MPYIVSRRAPGTHQITFAEILRGEIPMNQFSYQTGSPTGTVTFFVEKVSNPLISKTNVLAMIRALKEYKQRNQAIASVEDRHKLYHSFKMPKKAGGYRTIDAPEPPLMNALRDLKQVFEINLGARYLYHTAAHAYIEGRSSVTCMQRHQKFGGKWFLKTDFSNFFGNTSKKFLLSMLSQIFPFSEIMKDEEGKDALEFAIDLCMLDGGLPQGTPMSPMLTNIMMIPIDHYLATELGKHGFLYTRYADDIQISRKTWYDHTKTVAFMRRALQKFNAPFVLKDEKTRFGSSSGHNFNLGLCLNKDNELTVGWRAKDQIKARLDHFIRDTKSRAFWDIQAVQSLEGMLNYHKMVEKDYTEYMIRRYEEKYRINLAVMFNGYYHMFGLRS